MVQSSGNVGMRNLRRKWVHPLRLTGFLDPDLIVASFVRHFKAVCTDERNEVSCNLRAMYNNRRHNVGAPFDNTYLVDAELVEQMIGNMHRGKAAGLDGFTAEHLLSLSITMHPSKII